MQTIQEHRAHHGSINLVSLKTEILSALSAVGGATSIEELRQADAAYKKALCTAQLFDLPTFPPVHDHRTKTCWLS